jgi:hypothetical protein
MDSIEKLISAITMVEEARGVPLSASCVLHRGELLDLLDDVRTGLPEDLATARNLIATRDAIVEDGHRSAEQLVAIAREEVARMVEQTAVVQSAREESERILAAVHATGEREREEVENYIDSRLATLEVILNKTMDAVVRGRERLAGAGDNDVLGQLAQEK